MANLPEKNITLVDKITSIPSNSNLFLNADGEFRQASVNDVIKSATVVSDTVNNAINDAMQDSIDSHFKQATGSPILLTDTADGVASDFKAYGRSEQKQYSGKNLLENTATTTSLNGGTFTVNEDGSVNVKGAFTDVTEFSIGTYNATESSILSGCPSGGSENTYQLRSSGIGADYGGGLGITAGSNTSIYIRVMSGQTIDITFKPMVRLASITDATYEPYVGGVASPNPDYPQATKSVADSGYFDGELLQGYYNTDGSVNGVAQYVSAKNLMPCNVGDVIKFTYAETVTKLVILFFDDTKYLSQVGADNSSIVNVTAPSGATRFGITIQSVNGITPQTAKHITVTINGKYALIVKSVGKNLLDTKTTVATWNGITYTPITNENGKVEYVSISGTKTSDTYFILPINATKLPSTLKAGNKYIVSANSTNSNVKISVIELVNGNYVTNSTATEIEWAPNANATQTIIRIDVGTSLALNDVRVYPMIRPIGTDGTYEPYKETISYIPLNEPLRSSLDGSVKDEVSLTEVTRRFTEVVFDGTETIELTITSTNCVVFRIKLPTLAKPFNMNCLSDKFVYQNGFEENTEIEHCRLTNQEVPYFCLYINKDRASTVDELKTWLQANPITVIYELAEPITEYIEPVDIVTYDNVTYLTASDNAEMELEYPTSKVAGIASIGYSKGRKAEYEVELLKAQLLELQTAMVNSL